MAIHLRYIVRYHIIYLLLVQSMYRDMYISYHVSQVGTIHRGCEVVCMLHVN